MLKKLLIGSVLPLFCICAVLLHGCSSTTTATTTTLSAAATTTTATTTTTLAGTHSISGRVSWTWPSSFETSTRFGTLVLMATNEVTGFNAGVGGPTVGPEIRVATGETSKDYTFPNFADGPEYVLGIIFTGISTTDLTTVSSTELATYRVIEGEFSNGHAGYNVNTPQEILVSGSNITGKDFQLLDLWPSAFAY